MHGPHSSFKIALLSFVMGLYNLLILPFQLAEVVITGKTTIDPWGML